jgi:hypothetical protein
VSDLVWADPLLTPGLAVVLRDDGVFLVEGYVVGWEVGVFPLDTAALVCVDYEVLLLLDAGGVVTLELKRAETGVAGSLLELVRALRLV